MLNLVAVSQPPPIINESERIISYKIACTPSGFRPACASTLSDKSSLGVLSVAKDPKRSRADSEDSYQPALVRRLIRVFADRIFNLVRNAVSQLNDFDFF